MADSLCWRVWTRVGVLEDVDSSGVLKAFLVQIAISSNHQNGKDTHLRGVKVFAPVIEYVPL
jgi:anaphase-promoting complex subunit 10